MNATSFQVPIEVTCAGTPEPVMAFLSATPGLVVHRGLHDFTDYWSVTHERSGTTVGYAENPEQAQAFAAALGPVADWTLSGVELLSIVDRGVWRAVRAQFGVFSLGPTAHEHEALSR